MLTREENTTRPLKLEDGLSLYVHIPFCETKCPYCDFNTYAGIEPLISSYIAALCQEIVLWGRLVSRPRIKTIFFGGGTPSYIPTDELERVSSAIREAFNVVPDAEATVEANPDDCSFTKLHALRHLGVNRLSIGVQSLDDALLSLLGRRHNAAQAREAYLLAKQAGFDNVNPDLMYGLPTQTMSQWQRTLESVLELRPTHMSLYALTLEKGTPMERQVTSGLLPAPDPDLAAEMYTLACAQLGEEGYHHYEISNWAKPGYESRHNLTYWLNQPYLGVGPGAHSYLPGYRFFNVKSPRIYITKVQDWADQGVEPVQSLSTQVLNSATAIEGIEPIDTKLEMAETVFLGLRLLDGLKLDGFEQRFRCELLNVYSSQIDELVQLGLLELSSEVLRLTERGVLVSNQVFMRFLP